MQGVATPRGLEQALGRDLAALLANNSPSGYLRMLLGMWGALLRARVRNITRSVGTSPDLWRWGVGEAVGKMTQPLHFSAFKRTVFVG